MEFILAALTFGITAGLKPGPLGIYVIHQTLNRGYAAGFSASFAPFVSDGPIILLAFFVLHSMRNTPLVLACISIAGAVYLFLLAWKLLRTKQRDSNSNQPGSFLTAVKINLLNPVAYTFWMTAGGTYLVKGTPQQAATFVVFMLGSLALSKFMLGASIRILGNRFSDKHYLWLLKSLAIILAGFAINLLIEGVNAVLLN